MDPEKKFYGLIIPKKNNKVQQKTKSIFDSDSDDNGPSLPRRKPTEPPKSTKAKITEQKLINDDPSIYEYDTIYDTIKEQNSQHKIEAKKKNPRFIESLLKAADKRKKDQDRRLEKKIQDERVKEGDEFKDKEAFVTSAYKQKMEEMEKEEERERMQNQMDEMMDVTKQKDLSGFYRHYLKQTVGEEQVPEFGQNSFSTTHTDIAGEVKHSQQCTSHDNKSTEKDEASKSHKKPEKSCSRYRSLSSGSSSGHEELQKKSSSHHSSSDTSNITKHSVHGRDISIKKEKRRSRSNSSSEHDKPNEHTEQKSSSSHHSRSHTLRTTKHSTYEKNADIKKEKRKRRSSSSSSACSSHDERVLKKPSSSHHSHSNMSTTSKHRTTKEKDPVEQTQMHQGSALPNPPSLEKETSGSLHDTTEFNDDDDDDILISDAENTDGNKTEQRHSAMNDKFKKRTVGKVFEMAQERYFKRMAARGTL